MNKIQKHKKDSQIRNQKWRDIQREQLGYSANIYFLFSSAILGFSLDLWINKKAFLSCVSIVLLTISISFIILSLMFYALFTNNRLNDFRQTAKYYKKEKTPNEVSELTEKVGERTWLYYRIQFYSLALGFLFALIGIGIYIYS
ncbi:hypothetical protein [Flavobacterium sp.]|jgi:hypothetical protein|uniref:hypothetical protein n=1 Tax=Flavobacterium sp. TaxID=239 RepID=UPI0037C0B5BC